MSYKMIRLITKSNKRFIIHENCAQLVTKKSKKG